VTQVVETMTYADGDARISADILDNGSVRFSIRYPRAAKKTGVGVSASVLEDLAQRARKAKLP